MSNDVTHREGEDLLRLSKYSGLRLIEPPRDQPFMSLISGWNYSGLGLIEPPRDQPFMSLISGWNYYPGGLFSKKSKFALKSGPNKRRAPLTGALLSGVYCTEEELHLLTFSHSVQRKWRWMHFFFLNDPTLDLAGDKRPARNSSRIPTMQSKVLRESL